LKQPDPTTTAVKKGYLLDPENGASKYQGNQGQGKTLESKHETDQEFIQVPWSAWHIESHAISSHETEKGVFWYGTQKSIDHTKSKARQVM
jgi:hypothetical protein